MTWPGKRLQQHGLVLKDNGGDPSFLMFRDILGKTIFCNYLFFKRTGRGRVNQSQTLVNLRIGSYVELLN